MKKILSFPVTYIAIIFALFSVVTFSLTNSYVAIAVIALLAIVFYYLGDMGAEKRESIAKSIGGGGIKRPNTGLGG